MVSRQVCDSIAATRIGSCTGALPEGALIAELARMGKKQIDRTAHDGHIVVTRALADVRQVQYATGGVPCLTANTRMVAASATGR
jgi:hypothetical protein